MLIQQTNGQMYQSHLNNHKQCQEFNVQEWLKTINIWDEKFDYVMHDDHWLTSKWSPDCEKCQANGNNHKPQMTNSNITTSSPVRRNSISMDSTANEPTLKNDNSHRDSNNIETTSTTPTPRPPPPVTIAMTPIAPANISTRAFVTPYTATKFGGNETFNRTTRQSTKKLLNQTASQDLIDLNETFDLYRSALAETPQVMHQPPVASKIPKIPVRLSRPIDPQTSHSNQ